MVRTVPAQRKARKQERGRKRRRRRDFEHEGAWLFCSPKKQPGRRRRERTDSASSYKHSCDSRLQRASDQRTFLRQDRERRSEKYVIAAHAINTALRRIDEHIFLKTGLANFLCDVLLFLERFVSGFVLHKLDTEQKAKAANIPDMRMRLKRRKGSAQLLPGGIYAIKKFVRFEIIENSVARGGGDWMRLISEAVHEGARAPFECRDDARGNENRAERRVTAGHSLTHQNNVRFDAPMLDSERLSGAAHSGKPFAVQHWGVEPDIILVGKGVASGYAPLGAVLVSARVVAAFERGSGAFMHGFTYQAHPVSTAAGNAVLDYLESHKLFDRVNTAGQELCAALSPLQSHPHVGDIRGLGLLLGVEFMKDKATHEPFQKEQDIAEKIREACLEENVLVYPTQGCVDGVRGDHVLLAPPFTILPEECALIARALQSAVARVFVA